MANKIKYSDFFLEKEKPPQKRKIKTAGSREKIRVDDGC